MGTVCLGKRMWNRAIDESGAGCLPVSPEAVFQQRPGVALNPHSAELPPDAWPCRSAFCCPLFCFGTTGVSGPLGTILIWPESFSFLKPSSAEWKEEEL